MLSLWGAAGSASSIGVGNRHSTESSRSRCSVPIRTTSTLEHFEREQRAMGRVSGHPNIVPVLHSGLTFTGRPYIVMPYHSRDTLGSWIKGHGPLAVHEALTIGVRLAGALETAHRAGVLHRDVKPPNVLLTTYGEPQLSDFGIARIAGSRETAANIIVGSPSYIAPELFEGRAASIAADVYSLAATVFTLLSGEPPFPFRQGENPIAFVRRVMAGPIPDLRAKGVPDPICSAVELGLNIDPARRPSSAAAFGETLRAAGAHIGLNIAEVPLELPASATDADEASPDAGTPVSIGYSAALGLRSDTSGSISRTQTPPSAPTRFRPPTFNRPTVPRQRILDRLGSGRRPKLVLIHAPAGYGKSTLAAQWGQILTQQGLKGAWLAIDSDDNNAVWFLAHLIEAIRRTMPELADTLQQEFEGHLENTSQYVLNALINCLHSDKQTLALVLEDWHRVDNTETTNALAYLLENCCHHLHLIVTSRTHTGLPLSTLRVQGELVEIDASHAASSIRPNPRRCWSISAASTSRQPTWPNSRNPQTDGPPPCSWHRCRFVTTPIRPHSSSICPGGTKHWASIWRRTSWTASNRTYSISCCRPASPNRSAPDWRLRSPITGVVEASSKRSRNVISFSGGQIRKDRGSSTTTFSPSTFCTASSATKRIAIPELHRRAAQWFTEHQMLSQAVDHLILAGDARQAVDAVEQAATDLMEQSQMSTLIGLAAKLPAQHADGRPRLQVDLAWANVVLHRLAAAEDALRLAEVGIDSVPTDQAGDLRAEMDLIRAVIAAFQDRIDTSTDAAVAACVDRVDTSAPLHSLPRSRPRVISCASSVGLR